MDKLQKFYFQAVDKDNKRISGSIFSENKQDAREKLRLKGLALFSIEEFDSQKAQVKSEGLSSFDFEGTNPDGKHVHGKIEAISDYEAYKKLRKEYDFELTSIVDSNLDFEEKSKIIAGGIPEEFKDLYKADSYAFKKKKRKKKIEVVEISEKDKQELAFYSYEINLISQEIHSLLDKSDKYLNKEEKRNILERLGLIERLKQSNAVDHLKNLTHKLVDELTNDKVFMEEKLLSEEEKSERNDLKNEFEAYSKNKKKNLVSKALEINLAFNVDARQLAVNIVKARPITQVGFIIYWTLVSLFCLMTVLWIKNGVEVFILGKSITESLYIFRSMFLWIITAISLLNMMIFAPMVFNPKTFSFNERIIFFSMAFFLNILVVLALPNFF